jgi:hypothetical protein
MQIYRPADEFRINMNEINIDLYLLCDIDLFWEADLAFEKAFFDPYNENFLYVIFHLLLFRGRAARDYKMLLMRLTNCTCTDRLN